MSVSTIQIWNKIFTNGELNTVKFECIDGILFAPEIFLVEKSDYFAKMLKGEMIESKNKIVKVEKTSEVVHVVLTHICTDTSVAKSVSVVFETMDLARMWLIKDFIEDCSEQILTEWKTKSKIIAFDLAMRFKFDVLATSLLPMITNIILDQNDKNHVENHAILQKLSYESTQALLLFIHESERDNFTPEFV